MTAVAIQRAALEERREQALADLAALEREPDRTLAERLRRNSEHELAEVLAALDALDDPAPPRRRPRVGAAVAVAVILAGVAALAAGAVDGRPAGGFVTGGVATDASTSTSTVPEDLSSVTNEEMEEVVRANPAVVPMRLALVERYLRAGDANRARDHALRALQEPIEGDERARALKYLGWSTALVGRPAEGSALLEESLAMVPTDLDTLWFLGNVRLDAMADPGGAATLFERILAEDIPDDRRRVVADRLEDARLVASTTAVGP